MQTYSYSYSKFIPQWIALLLSAGTLSNLFLIPVVFPSPSNTITTSSQSSNEPLQAAEFEKALTFTLQWEGGYSNHANDRGGRTFKGITQAKAKEYGVSDPRHLTDIQIHQIYQRSYWDAQKCWQYLPPLNYVCFDTAVNFGRFYFNEKLPNDPREAATKVLHRRMAYRYQRVKEQPNQRVFLEGWLNRDRALLNWVKTSETTS